MARADCPNCQGSGWKVVERRTEGAQALEPTETAQPGPAASQPKSVWAVPCDCTVEDRTTHALLRSRIPERYRNCDFENFETDNEYGEVSPLRMRAWNESLAQAKVVVQAFARDFPIGSERGLLLMGECGVGKTHLAVAALREVVLRGHFGLFYDYGELLKSIQNSYNPQISATEMSVLDPVLKAELLLLDDLGSSKSSYWALEIVGHILNSRYNEKRFTLITTNFLDAELKRIPQREAVARREGMRGKEGPSVDLTRSRSVVTLPSGELVSEITEDTLEERIGKRNRSRLYEMCRTIYVSSPDYRKELRNH